MTERIDISQHVEALCRDLNLGDKEFVAELLLRPHTVTAKVYRRNDAGTEFIDELGKVVQDEFEIAVAT
jgi:hypothetical protein